MKKYIFCLSVIFLPFSLAVTSAVTKSLWLAAATIFLNFVVVTIVPFCRKNENLWMFIMVAITSIPINYFLLEQYAIWMNVFGVNKGLVYALCMIEQILILSSFEEIALGVITRMIWKNQFPIFREE